MDRVFEWLWACGFLLAANERSRLWRLKYNARVLDVTPLISLWFADGHDTRFLPSDRYTPTRQKGHRISLYRPACSAPRHRRIEKNPSEVAESTTSNLPRSFTKRTLQFATREWSPAHSVVCHRNSSSASWILWSPTNTRAFRAPVDVRLLLPIKCLTIQSTCGAFTRRLWIGRVARLCSSICEGSDIPLPRRLRVG
jgi:hypothetical protein